MSAGEDARNVPPKIHNYCHPQNEFSQVVCMLCDVPYCKSCFVRKVNKGKGFFVTNTLVVCPEHSLSYNDKHVQDVDDENFNRMDILILKAELINQEILNLKSQDTSSSDINSDEEDSNDSTCNVLSMGMLVRENKSARKQIKEMTKNNNELIENNRFLRSNLEKNNDVTHFNYANAVKMDSNTIDRNFYGQINGGNIQTIIITPNTNFNGDILVETKNALIKIKKPITNIRKGRKSIIVKCNQLASQEIKSAIENDLKDIAQVEFAGKYDPLVRIYGVENDLTEDEIKQDICDRNSVESDSFKIEYIYPKKQNTRVIKLRVKPDFYLRISNQRGLYVGYQKCRYGDDFNLNCCRMCQGYKHKFSECKEIRCVFCSGEHESQNCNKKDEKKCINCIRANQKLTKKRDVNHVASDKGNCDTYKSLWTNIVNNTDYPMRPVFGDNGDKKFSNLPVNG